MNTYTDWDQCVRGFSSSLGTLSVGSETWGNIGDGIRSGVSQQTTKVHAASPTNSMACHSGENVQWSNRCEPPSSQNTRGVYSTMCDIWFTCIQSIHTSSHFFKQSALQNKQENKNRKTFADLKLKLQTLFCLNKGQKVIGGIKSIIIYMMKHVWSVCVYSAVALKFGTSLCFSGRPRPVQLWAYLSMPIRVCLNYR